MPQKHSPGTTEGFLTKLRQGGFKDPTSAKKSIGKMATWSAAEKKRAGQLADEYFADPAKFSVTEFYKAAPAAKAAAAARLDPPVLTGAPSTAASPSPLMGRVQATAGLDFLERLVRVSNEVLVGLSHAKDLYPEADISEGQVVIQSMSVAIGVIEKLTAYALIDLPTPAGKASSPKTTPKPKEDAEPDKKSAEAEEREDADEKAEEEEDSRPPWAKKSK